MARRRFVRYCLNAMMDVGFRLTHVEELFAEKDYEQPVYADHESLPKGKDPSREEIDRMYNWRINSQMALLHWLCAVGKKSP